MAELKQNWQDLFKNFRVSLDAWKIVLALMGLVLSVAGGALLWQLGTWPPAGTVSLLCLAAAITFAFILRSCLHSEVGIDGKKVGLLAATVVILALLVWLFYEIFPPQALSCVGIFAFLLVVWSVFGGAITRITSLELATDNRIGVGEALKFAGGKFNAYFWSILTPLCALVFIAVFTTVGGWVAAGGCWGFLNGTLLMVAIYFATVGILMLANSVLHITKNQILAFLVAVVISAVLCLLLFWLFGVGKAMLGVRYLEWVVALLTPLFIIAGFLMVLILIGLVFGAPMMFPAVSAEGSDSFDAISRTYSYLYGRPWRYILYQFLGLGYFSACFLFVTRFAQAMVGTVARTVEFGMGTENYAPVSVQVQALLSPVWNPICDFFARGLALLAWAGVPDFVSRAYARIFVFEKLPILRPGLGLGVNQHITAVLVAIFLYILLGVVLGYLVSLALSTQTTIYLLMRKNVDGTAMTEVYQEEKGEEEKLEEALEEEAPPEEAAVKVEAEPKAAPPTARKKPARKRPVRRKTTARRTTRKGTRRSSAPRRRPESSESTTE